MKDRKCRAGNQGSQGPPSYHLYFQGRAEYAAPVGLQNRRRPRECGAKEAWRMRGRRDPEHCAAKHGRAAARSFPSKVRVSLTQERPLEVNTRQHLAPFYATNKFVPPSAFGKKSAVPGWEPQGLSGKWSPCQKNSGNRSSYCVLCARAFYFQGTASIAPGLREEMCASVHVQPRIVGRSGSLSDGEGARRGRRTEVLCQLQLPNVIGQL